MELSEANLVTLSQYLHKTLNPGSDVRRPETIQRQLSDAISIIGRHDFPSKWPDLVQQMVEKFKTAEKFLESIEDNKNYPLLLLHLIDKNEIDLTIRVAGGVAFKNYIKRNWKIDEDGIDRIHQEDRNVVKQLIVELMLRSPETIQRQLSDAISIIGRHDFPSKWPDLVQQMVEKFKTGDFHVINGVLRTAHSLFKRYRYEFKSQELWTEIKHVLDRVAQPLTDLFIATLGLAATHAANNDALRIIYNSLVLICKLFYSLNFQDLPEFFEDNMEIWMSNFLKLLTTDVPCLKTPDDEDAGVLEQLRCQICDNITLYAQKYDEEFQKFLAPFVTAVWNLLVTTGSNTKYDQIVSNALQFLASVADRAQYRHLFEDPEVLGNICHKVIIPNMEFRASDEELFEDNPEEYIRRDIEGSDVDTRRRASCDLVKVLSLYFEAKITEVFGGYVQMMLSGYSQSPSTEWKNKDVAMYLVTSLAGRGGTQRHGVTQISQLVDLNEFARNHVLNELTRQNVNELPVLKADAIKYILTFRSVLPKELVVSSLPELVRHLMATSSVTHSYAASAIEKILILRQDNQPVVKGDDLNPIAGDLLNGLFTTLDRQGSEENEYVMKAIMRSFSTLQERVVPFLRQLLPKLTNKLSLVARNPSRPHFNHYLFETLSLSIRIVCTQNPSAVSSFEEALFPILQNILQQDVQEFIPYSFQILSLLVEIRGRLGSVPEPYLMLFPCLLSPVLWERTANIRPLVRLLQAFITHSNQEIVATDKVSGILGVFQKLIASKANDHEGFNLIQSMIQHLSNETLSPFIKQVFLLLFQRLSSSKTTKYIKGLIVFFCLYVVKNGPSELISMIDGIQPQMFGMVIERLFIPELQKINGNINRKIVSVGMSRLLCEAAELYSQGGIYSNFWIGILQSLIALFELPQDESTIPEDQIIEIEETIGYNQASYAHLTSANFHENDPLEGVTDPRLHLAQSLANLSTTRPGQIPQLLSSGQFSDAERIHLKNYIDAANVQIA